MRRRRTTGRAHVTRRRFARVVVVLVLATACCGAVCGQSEEHRSRFHCKNKPEKKVRCSIQELTDASWNEKLRAKATYVMLYEPDCCDSLIPLLKLAGTALRKVGLAVAAVDVAANPKVREALIGDVKKRIPCFFFCADTDPKECVRHKRKKVLTVDDVVDWALEEAVDQLMILPSKFDVASDAYDMLKERRYGPASPWELPEDKEDFSHIARDARGDFGIPHHTRQHPTPPHDEL